MDIFERHLLEFSLRIKLDNGNLFILTSFMCFHNSQLHPNCAIIDQYHKINEIKGIKKSTVT
jgi:hypothetical protein